MAKESEKEMTTRCFSLNDYDMKFLADMKESVSLSGARFDLMTEEFTQLMKEIKVTSSSLASTFSLKSPFNKVY